MTLHIEKQKQILLSLCYYFISDFQPFSTTESAGFRAFCAAMNPSFTLPSRRTLLRRILGIYEQIATKVILTVYLLFQVVDEAMGISACCATFDSWTSVAMESYMGITIHYIDDRWKMRRLTLACKKLTERHTAKHLQEVVVNVLKGVCLDRTVAGVHDNASNMVAMELPFAALRCIAHTVQLSVTAGLKPIEPTLKRVRELVKFIRKSIPTMNEVIRLQTELKQRDEKAGIKDEKWSGPLKPILDVATRWNSSFRMLQRIFQLKPHINSVLVNSKKYAKLLLTASEWSAVEELVEVLGPFNEATEMISGESYPTLSLVYPVFCNLWTLATDLKSVAKHPETQALCRSLAADLRVRWINTIRDEHLIACFLDPRFKHLTFIDDANLRKYVRDLAETKFREATKGMEEKEPAPPVHVHQRRKSLLESMKQMTGSHSKSDDEISTYNSLPILDISTDVLAWWRENESKLPHLGTFHFFELTACSCSRSPLSLHRRHFCPLRKTIFEVWGAGFQESRPIASRDSSKARLSEWKSRVAQAK